jgi:uncharacterized protein YndB with AHSA1/START domain
MSTTVTTSVVVDTPIERAFAVFTKDMGSWWDPDHHLIDNFASMEVETFAGGRIIDHAADGSSNSWAQVRVYEPPTRFVFSWEIDPRWEIETDPAKFSEVEVTFTATGDAQTTVTLEHRHLDRHGEGWEAKRDAVGGPNGWTGLLDAYRRNVSLLV